MRKSFVLALALAGVMGAVSVGNAGGKADGERCHVSKSCSSKLCVRQQPLDKFGVCCRPQECPEIGAQCGTVDNGCGIPTFCGDCGPGNDCIANQCVPVSTTTSTTSTTSSTTSTTTTSTTSTTTTSTTSSTTTTSTTVTSTTLGFPKACTVDLCGDNEVIPPGDGIDCYCDELSCTLNDGCSNRDEVCPSVCDTTTTTTTTSTTTSTTNTLP